MIRMRLANSTGRANLSAQTRKGAVGMNLSIAQVQSTSLAMMQ